MALKCAVLVVAAGRGQRFGGGLPKQYRDLGGRPVLGHSLATFAAHPEVRLVRAVIHPDDRPLYDHASADLPLLEPVPGGASRQESVRLGLESLAGLDPAPDVVLIHDGARPLVDPGLVSRVIAALTEHDGAIPALPMADTVKRADGDGFCLETVPREALWRAQTPQGFRFAPILAAHRAAAGRELTDDAAVLEANGGKVKLVLGAERNTKVTTSDDLRRLSRLFTGAEEMRTGTGYDVHKLEEGDGVFLCGIKIPHDRKLAGHSDADVALHALTDALLGAIGAGDIGHHFPPSDAQWKGAASDQFLAHAARLVRALGGRIVNADLTVVCEAPKVGPHRPAMIARTAEILELPAGRVSVKATTSERLGFTGREEGIAALASVTVALPALDG
ncbi:bifunctional 2-C-methyl-D-erythritol 4-phosphate cytidylyltransferase/2-C-methyl-D-erythritol 2,4-cyclodiphosphate synthase [Roseospirillum parvum]|uniref:Bifunctional enzyme IspD/IspF n=1 Tax=Roseospirillum parvum TaxID=83401 RepID=A0A1G7YAN5_9PROT|nr:bifunctional 2-C-methyl-D-erythritol 4-phosphate cytidylyltransferase/2-C-methyl-D-erythritol 2,4-cyclodiphosphate synthase [Roseospirillum parvum]SDG93423.1 2-C-methyl-D-erythritol 4-phosphate cytidylyltransferase / 2-C-methyl-D-erythritol 2,4-cyclodiphosphate synthase [Roseospirillum parvum]